MYYYDIEFVPFVKDGRPACEYREGFKTLKAAKAAATRAAKNIICGEVTRITAGDAEVGLVRLAEKAGYSEEWINREW